MTNFDTLLLFISELLSKNHMWEVNMTPRARLISIVHGHAFCRFAKLILLGRMLLAISVCLRNYYIVKDMPQRSWFAENKWQRVRESCRQSPSDCFALEHVGCCFSLFLNPHSDSQTVPRQFCPASAGRPWYARSAPLIFIPTINGCRAST